MSRLTRAHGKFRSPTVYWKPTERAGEYAVYVGDDHAGYVLRLPPKPWDHLSAAEGEHRWTGTTAGSQSVPMPNELMRLREVADTVAEVWMVEEKEPADEEAAVWRDQQERVNWMDEF